MPVKHVFAIHCRVCAPGLGVRNILSAAPIPSSISYAFINCFDNLLELPPLEHHIGYSQGTPRKQPYRGCSELIFSSLSPKGR
jgi:hypothetical protein